MSLEITATFEGGVLKPDNPLPLLDGQRVRVTVSAPAGRAGRAMGYWPGKASRPIWIFCSAQITCRGRKTNDLR